MVNKSLSLSFFLFKAQEAAGTLRLCYTEEREQQNCMQYRVSVIETNGMNDLTPLSWDGDLLCLVENPYYGEKHRSTSTFYSHEWQTSYSPLCSHIQSLSVWVTMPPKSLTLYSCAEHLANNYLSPLCNQQKGFISPSCLTSLQFRLVFAG